MKNIKLTTTDKYKESTRYQWIRGSIYKDLQAPKFEGFNNQDDYVFSISYELEEGDDSQYPLEDILDKFSLYVSDVFDQKYDSELVSQIELCGELIDVENAIDSIIGKRVYTKESEKDKDGNVYVNLVIE